MPAITCQAVVERIEVLAFNVRSFRLRLVEPKQLPFDAGQFVIIHVPKDGSTVKRAYSVASPPHEAGVVELCIQHVEKGAASTFFWQLKEGAPVTLSGPHGKFSLKQPITYQPVFMCTGTGVAPFRSMLKHLYHLNVMTEMWLLFGTRYEHSLLYEAEFRAMASMRRGFHYLPTVSRPKDWKGETGHIQQTFQRSIKDYTDKEIYICGWMEIVKQIVKDLESFGVPRAQIHFEEWA